MWLIMAILSAFFAGITSILAKCGIKKTNSDLATALRTIVVLAFSWLMVAVVDSAGTISEITPKSFVFLILSGAATGASWICYFKALALGDVNKVVPVDKSSTVLTVLLAIFLFQEKTHLILKLAGTLLLAAGIFLMIEKKTDFPKKRKPALADLCPSFRSVCFPHLYSCKGGDHRRGIQSWNRHPHRRSTDYGLACGIDQKPGNIRQTFKGSSEGRASLYFPLRTCHRRLLALLLLCNPKRAGQRGSSH